MREFCALCGARINQVPVDGTDPGESDGSWYEVYECADGHEGRLEWSSGDGTTTTGALREDVEVIA